MLIITQVVAVTYISRLQEHIGRLNASVSSLEDRFFLSHVNTSETRRYKNAVVDVSEQKIYIPDARIYVPLKDTDPQIMYDYRESQPKNSEFLYVSTAKIVGNQYSLTQYESCDKLITITSAKQQYGTFVKEIKPAAGNLRYVYVYSESSCDIYPKGYWESIKNIAESIRSYSPT